MSTSLPAGPAAESHDAPAPAVAANLAPAADASVAPAWSRAQAVLFRFVLVYALLYTAPEPFRSLLHAIGACCDSLAWRLDLPWLAGAPFAWCDAAADWLGGVEGWWLRLASWLSERGLTPWPVVVEPTGSGDTAAQIVRAVAIGVVAVVAGMAWSLLVRRPTSYPRASRWLHLLVRWWLAFVLLRDGVAMLYVGKFGELTNARLLGTIGDASPMGLLWTFMAASPAYETLAGVLVVAPALLLLHRRTALLGALLGAVVLANVVALYWCYDVPVKLNSTHLFVAALALLWPWRASLWALFAAGRSCAPPDLAVVRAGWLRVALTVAGALLATAHLLTLHVEHRQYAVEQAAKAGPRPELHGVWTVESMKVERGSVDPAGSPAVVEVPPTDATRWRQLVIGRGVAYAEDLAGTRIEFTYGEDLAAGFVTLQPKAGDGEAKWTASREQAMRTVSHPEPETIADFVAKVERPRTIVRLSGSYAGKRVELQLVQRVFDLQRGFHFRQEHPYHR
jgi:hypothetical protein